MKQAKRAITRMMSCAPAAMAAGRTARINLTRSATNYMHSSPALVELAKFAKFQEGQVESLPP